MAVSSIDWNSPARRPVSPGVLPSRGTVAFSLDAPMPDPRPPVSEARARDDRAAAADRNERIASDRAADAAANREAAQARDTAKAAAKAEAAARTAKAGDSRPAMPPRPRPAGAQGGSDRGPPRPAAPNDAPTAQADAKVPPGAPATRGPAAPARDAASSPEAAAGETAAADTSEDTQPAAQTNLGAPIVPLPVAPPPSAAVLAAQSAASAGSGEAVPAEDPAGPAAPVVAAGADAGGTAAPVPHGLKIHAPAGRGEGSEGADAGNGKPQGDFAASLAPAAEGAARTDLAPAATAAPAPTHVKAAEAVAPGAPAAPAQPPVPLGAVPMTIGLRSLSGSNQFEIRLDPKDLGRIDVNLDIDKETGAVQARLVVDRPETLALLQRDAGNLQQALAQAGLNPGEGSIELSLRGDGQSDGRSSGSGGDGQRSDTGRSARADSPDPNPIAAVPMRRYGALSGIDIRI
ncbi:flagellar hook-length control protein FliK [Methylobacterium sp. M6A4_1b]